MIDIIFDRNDNNLFNNKEYDKLGDKWISLNYDWRDIINDTTRKVSFVTSTPTKNLADKQLISFVYPEDEFTYYDNIRYIFGEDKCGLDLITAVHELIGKITTPATFIGTHVPYFLYLSDVDDIISFLEDLKIRAQQICCERKRYLEYGGDVFLNYLKSI